jgi:two-component system chemotaxis response regulator CheB
MDPPSGELSVRPAAGHLIVVGASAGGLEALLALVEELPPDLSAAVVVVLHTSESGAAALPAILSRRGTLSAELAEDGERLQAGRVYVAPGGVHMGLDDGRVRLDPGPRENGHRPAIDRMFRSAAGSFGSRAVGVLLSGTRYDGAAGAVAIKGAGGTVLVQDPEEALYPEMPATAISLDDPDEVLPAAKIAHRVAQILEDQERSDAMEREPEAEGEETREVLSDIGCPDCGGLLRRTDEGESAQLVCDLGHRYNLAALAEEQTEAIEAALWTSLRLLKERASLARRLADRALVSKRSSGRIFEETAEEAERHAEVLGSVLHEQIQSTARTNGRVHTS